MKILVTGGAGFIGSNFLLHSVKAKPEDHFVNADCLTYAANLLNLKDIEDAPNYEFSRTDITDKTAVAELFERVEPDVVFHFAAESHVDRSIVGPGAFIQANVVGTFHLLEAARARKDRIVFHHVSTDEVYGSLGSEGLFTEEHPYDPSSPYSASKASSDHLVRAYHRTYGLPVRITNCSNNYGPYQFPEKLMPLIIRNCLKRLPLPIYGKGENIRDWLYVHDHCTALWAVHEKGRMGGTYNIGGNNEAKNIDLVKLICKIVAEETNCSEQELLGLITYVQDRPGHDLRYAIDATKVRDECGWEPQESIETGLRKTVQWYVAHQDWVESITSGDYKKWILANYGDRSVSA
jgi:dTDP-glucose 4,6-dehydratase